MKEQILNILLKEIDGRTEPRSLKSDPDVQFIRPFVFFSVNSNSVNICGPQFNSNFLLLSRRKYLISSLFSS